MLLCAKSSVGMTILITVVTRLIFWSPSPKPEVLSFSDASESGWGGFTAQVGGKVAVGSWSLEEMGRSSTFRELRATGNGQRVFLINTPSATGGLASFRPDNGTFCAVLISCLPVMGRHSP